MILASFIFKEIMPSNSHTKNCYIDIFITCCFSKHKNYLLSFSEYAWSNTFSTFSLHSLCGLSPLFGVCFWCHNIEESALVHKLDALLIHWRFIRHVAKSRSQGLSALLLQMEKLIEKLRSWQHTGTWEKVRNSLFITEKDFKIQYEDLNDAVKVSKYILMFSMQFMSGLYGAIGAQEYVILKKSGSQIPFDGMVRCVADKKLPSGNKASVWTCKCWFRISR